VTCCSSCCSRSCSCSRGLLLLTAASCTTCGCVCAGAGHEQGASCGDRLAHTPAQQHAWAPPPPPTHTSPVSSWQRVQGPGPPGSH
jgi:hypothetical protein